MNIASISPKLPEQNGGSTVSSANQMNMQQFLVLLSVQLATQNPLEPMSDRDFFAQLAQLGTVQGLDAMKTTMTASQTAGLIGKTVTAIRPYTDTPDGSSQIVTGKVEKVIQKNGEYLLMVKEANGGLVEVKPANVQSISA